MLRNSGLNANRTVTLLVSIAAVVALGIPVSAQPNPQLERVREARRLIEVGAFADAEKLLDAEWRRPQARGFLLEVGELRAEARLSQLDLVGAFDDCFSYKDKWSDYERYPLKRPHPQFVRAICHDVAGDAERCLDELLATFRRSRQPEREPGRLFATVVTGGTALLAPLLQRDDWTGSLARFLGGECSADHLLRRARESVSGNEPRDEVTRVRRLCEAHFFIGRDAERRGEVERARAHYRSSIATGRNRDFELMWSRARLARLDGQDLPFRDPHGERHLLGYADASGELVIPPRFYRAGPFEDGVARVEVRDCRAGVGVIDRAGRWVVPPVFDEVFSFGSNGLARVKRGERFGYVDREGHFAIALRFEDAGDFGTSELALAKDVELQRYGYLDPSGEWRIPPRFVDARPFSDGLAGVREDSDSWHVIDESGDPFGEFRSWLPIDFQDGVAFVRPEEGGLTGLIRRSGEWVIEPKLTVVQPFNEGVAGVRSGDVDEGERYYFIDADGKRVGAETFEDFRPFQDGLAAVQQGEAWGVVGRSGELVLEPKYSWVDVRGGMISIPNGKQQGFVDGSGGRVGDWFDRVAGFRNGTGRALTLDGWGLIDRNGEWVLPPGSSIRGPLCEGRVAVRRIASDADWAPLDPATFPEDARPWVARTSQEQQLSDVFAGMDRHLATLVAHVERKAAPDRDSDHSEKIALLNRAITILEAGRAAEFYRECLSPVAQVKASSGPGADDLTYWRLAKTDGVDRFVEHVESIAAARGSVLRSVLEHGGLLDVRCTLRGFLNRQLFMEAIPEYAEEEAQLFARLSGAQESLEILRFCRDELKREKRVIIDGPRVVFVPSEAHGGPWFIAFVWHDDGWRVDGAQKSSHEYL